MELTANCLAISAKCSEWPNGGELHECVEDVCCWHLVYVFFAAFCSNLNCFLFVWRSLSSSNFPFLSCLTLRLFPFDCSCTRQATNLYTVSTQAHAQAHAENSIAHVTSSNRSSDRGPLTTRTCSPRLILQLLFVPSHSACK